MGDSQKERILYIDFLRILSMMMVFFHHVRSEFILAEQWVPGILGVGWGALGVYIFIILSGYSLYLKKNDQLSFTHFYIKRFSKIIVPYWVFYGSFFLFYIFIGKIGYKNFNFYQFLISLTAFDTLINPFYIVSRYCLADWFVGFIILMYLFAPFLFCAFNSLKEFSLLIFLSISAIIITIYNSILILRVPFVQIFTFLVGVYLSCYLHRFFDKVRVFLFFLSFLVIFLVIFFGNYNDLFSFWARCISLSVLVVFFVRLVFLKLSFLNKENALSRTIHFGSSLSYMFFLCHHQVLFLTKDYFFKSEDFVCEFSFLLFIVPFLLTLVVSFFLNCFSNLFLAIFFKKLRFQ